MRLIDRYRAGECKQVADQLMRSGQTDDEAKLVANEIMVRVHGNLQTLVQRWRSLGFVLANPLGTPTEMKVLRRLEETSGELPLTLRAFYEQIGYINFIENPPDSRWTNREEFDPIAVDKVTIAKVGEINDSIENKDDFPGLILFDDWLNKFNIAGVGSIYVPIPMSGNFDAALYFEGSPLLTGNGERIYFVHYLRETILDRGGIGPFGPTTEIDSDLIKHLTADLQPF